MAVGGDISVSGDMDRKAYGYPSNSNDSDLLNFYLHYFEYVILKREP